MTTPSIPVQITFLSSIAGPDFPLALRRQAELGLTLLDLKDGLWGHNVEHLPPAFAARTVALCHDAEMAVHCFSTCIGRTPLATGPQAEASFRAYFEPALANVLRVAAELPTQFIRLLMPQADRAPGWLVGVYREWIERIAASGPGVLLENEVGGCLFSAVENITGFFEALPPPAVARYT